MGKGGRKMREARHFPPYSQANRVKDGNREAKDGRSQALPEIKNDIIVIKLQKTQRRLDNEVNNRPTPHPACVP